MFTFPARSSRITTAWALALAGLALTTATADAAATSQITRELQPGAPTRYAVVVDAPNGGVENNVRITRAGDRVVVTDNADGARAGDLTCKEFLTGAPVTDARVECDDDRVTSNRIFPRDGNDSVIDTTDIGSFTIMGSGNDQFVGGSGSDRVRGDLGADVVSGGGGDDSIDGNEDFDILDGGAGKDTLDGGDHADTLFGGTGADLLKQSPGPDEFHGGQDLIPGQPESIDEVTYTVGTVTDDPPVRVTLDDVANDGRGSEGDNVRSDVERVRGGNGPDHFIGDDRPNIFLGDDAGDLLDGRGGADDLRGDFGTDELQGGEGPDVLRGEGDSDVLLGGGGDDVLEGDDFGRYRDVISGGTGGDTVSYAQRFNAVRVDFDGVADDGETGENDQIDADVEHILGGKAGDTLTGDARANQITGGEGDDRIEGRLGADRFDGGAGNDTILARDGVADTVTCGTGIDTVDADPIDVLAADCEPPAVAPTPPAGGGATPPVADTPAGGEVLPGTGPVTVAGAPRACPAVRVSTRRATLSRGGALRVRLAAARGGETCTAQVTVGRTTKRVRLAPGAAASARFVLSRALRTRVTAGRSPVRVTVRVRTVDPSGRAATARAKVRLVR